MSQRLVAGVACIDCLLWIQYTWLRQFIPSLPPPGRCIPICAFVDLFTSLVVGLLWFPNQLSRSTAAIFTSSPFSDRWTLLLIVTGQRTVRIPYILFPWSTIVPALYDATTRSPSRASQGGAAVCNVRFVH